MEPVLTIGMATYRDFDGVYFTLQNLHATQRREGVTYLVVDNAPERCIRTQSVTQAVGGKYYHRPDLTGTSKPRDALFRFARTPWVMCVDSHVVFETGAIEDFISRVQPQPKYGKQKYEDCLIQGPLIRDDGIVLGTHWNQPAPPGLWGEWRDDKIGSDPTREPYEIRMHGLGLFAMRKDKWPGFNYLFKGFGGEEGYIHEKVRQRGGITVSFPRLRWRHRFRDIHGGWEHSPTPYPATVEDHTWNLLVGHRELGIDAVAQIYDHFGKRIPQKNWEDLLKASEALQPFKEEVFPKRKNLLAVWYSDNNAPPNLMSNSLLSIRRAQEETMRHNVDVITCSWGPIGSNPFQWTKYEGEHVRSHLTLARQITQGIEVMRRLSGREAYDAVIFMEHDVLYPRNYFDRVGDRFGTINPPVVSNLDYIGLNETGWLAVRERHEPMHQLSMRWDIAIENLQRIKDEAQGDPKKSILVEPQGSRDNWYRIQPTKGLGLIPSVHVNHKFGRFTSHGEVVFHPHSGGVKSHPHWGDAKQFWPGDMVEVPKQMQGDCGGCGGGAPPKFQSLEEWFKISKSSNSDFYEHVQTLKDLCDKCDVVTEIGMWEKPALVAMAYSQAKIVRSYAPKMKMSWPTIARFRGNTFEAHEVHNGTRKVKETDLLFVDTNHDAQTVYTELTQNKDTVKKYMVVHTTEIYGETGDNGQAGVLWGIRRFIQENREWTVIRNDNNNNGMMVLSKLKEDQKEVVGLVTKGLNFLKAMGKFAAKGFPTSSEEEFKRRMDICLLCEYRAYDTCAPCGCPLEKKLAIATEECGMVKLGLPPKWTPEIKSGKS